MTGYCVRCRAKQEILTPTRTLMKGRRAMIGVCACRGTKMSVAGLPEPGENLTAASEIG